MILSTWRLIVPNFSMPTGWVKGRYLIYKDVNRDFNEDLK